MKHALPLLAALALLPHTALAGDPKDPVVPTARPGEPVGYTVIPLGEVRVISVQEMMKTGGLITAETFPAPKRKKKKKKRVPISAGAAMAAGILGVAAVSGSGESGSTTLATPLDVRTPALPGSTVTRAAVSPEPGSAALCLLLLPLALGYFRTRSKNA